MMQLTRFFAAATFSAFSLSSVSGILRFEVIVVLKWGAELWIVYGVGGDMLLCWRLLDAKESRSSICALAGIGNMRPFTAL